MDDELQKALAAMLTKTTSAVEAGVSFLQAELPDMIRQLLLWKAVESAIFFVVFIVLCVWLCRVASRFWNKRHDTAFNYYDMQAVGCAMVAAFFGLLALNANSWLKIMIAPKVYLIEYAASLAK